MRPFTAMEDDRVKVTATLVPHGPVFPAYMFRFDTDHGSVTFSGDTTHSKTLIRLAKYSDVLVHEALQIPPGVGLTEEVIDHHKKSHVMVEDMGPVVQASHVDHLVLSHIENTGGTIDPVEWHRLACRRYDGAVTVGQDLQIITVA